jgi:hypothetical protein
MTPEITVTRRQDGSGWEIENAGLSSYAAFVNFPRFITFVPRADFRRFAMEHPFEAARAVILDAAADAAYERQWALEGPHA